MSEAGRRIDIAVVGATGLVGEALLGRLGDCGLSLGAVHVVAGTESVGREVPFGRRMLPLESLDGFDFTTVELALFALPEAVSGPAIEQACAAGCIVIDHSSLFRSDLGVPLVVAGTNDEMLADFRERGIIALPGGEATLLTPLLALLHARWALQRIDLVVLRSASADGRGGVERLARETAQLLGGRPLADRAQQRAFNLIPLVEGAEEGQRDPAAVAIGEELSRLLGDPGIVINLAVATLPLFFGEALHVRLQLQQPCELDEIRDLLGHLPALSEVGGAALIERVGSDEGAVIGLQHSAGPGYGVEFWLLADTLSAAIARNACDVLKVLEKYYL